MKNNKFKLPVMALVAASAFCLSSCSDFLTIEPKTFVSEDNFWNEKTDIDQMVAGVYCKMQESAFIERCIMWGETRSDNIAEGLNASDEVSIYRVLKENLLPTNPYTDWSSFYGVINQCNTVIEMAPVVSEKDPVYTASDVAATQAEMACLRDLCYFYLVRAFRDVPYYTHAVQSEAEVQNLPVTNGDEIVRALIADLEQCVGSALKAYPKDKSSLYDSDCNRVTQDAIYALLADLCLWDGQYQKTVDYAQKVIDSKVKKYEEDYATNVTTSSGALVKFQHTQDTYSHGFPLYPCFNGNQYGNSFDHIFGSYKNCFESVFELNYNYDGSNEATAISNSSVARLYGNHWVKDGNNGQGFLGVSEAVISDIAQKTWKVYELNQNDVRFYTDIYNPNAKSNEYTQGYSNKFVAYYSYVMSESGKYLASNTYLSYDNRNWIFYRLTDVMLMQAEALVELGGENTTYAEENEDGTTTKKYDDNLARAFYLTWAVNRRSMMTNNLNTYANELKISKYNTKSEMRELVLAERRRELMFEGKRWFDLLRQCHREGTTNYIKSHVGAKGVSASSSSLFANVESLYWPYNKREVINNPNLDQKPYYGGGDDDKGYESTVK